MPIFDFTSPVGSSSDTQILFNSSGSVAGSANLTWVAASGLTVNKHAAIGSGAAIDQDLAGSPATQVLNVRETLTADITATVFTIAAGLQVRLDVDPLTLSTLGNFGQVEAYHQELYVPPTNSANFSEVVLIGTGAGTGFHGTGAAPFLNIGASIDAWHDGTQRAASLIGLQVSPAAYQAGANLVEGVKTQALFKDSTSTQGIGIHVYDPQILSSGGVTTYYGLKIDDLAAGGTNYAIHTGSGLISFNGKLLTLSGNLTTTGAFNATIGVPSSSTWDLPSGGGTLVNLSGAQALSNKTGLISQWTNDSSYTTLAAVNAQTLAVFAATTSAQLAGVLSDETGFSSGAKAVFSIGPALTGQPTIAQGTITTALSPLTITETRNASGVTFPGIVYDVTNTASASASLLMDLKVGGSSVFKFGRTATDGFTIGTSTLRDETGGQLSVTNRTYYLSTSASVGLQVASTSLPIGWGSFGSGNDLSLYRDAARTPAFRDGTNPYKLRVYNTFTTLDTAGEWFAIDWQTTANVVNLQAVKGSSSGTARVLTISYGGAQASPVAAITVPITSGQVTFGGGLIAGGTLTHGAQYSEFTEMTAPAAPATNSVRIYAEDTGGGKTRLVALFPTGAAQVIATEP